MNGGIRALLISVMLLGAGAAAYSLRSDRVPDQPDRSAPEGVRVTVEVHNAGGRSDMARRATLWLRDLRYDVVMYGTANRSDLEVTIVYDRVGRPELAEWVRDALGVGVVETAVDSTLLVDVSVLLGRDWPPEVGGGEGGSSEAESDTPRTPQGAADTVERGGAI